VLVGSAISSAADPVRIGLSLGLSGQYYELGTMHERAYYLWQNEINEKGGLLGRPVEIIIEDDESDPEKAREIYRKLIFEDKVDLVFGPYSSRITAAVLPIVDEAGYPLLAAGASSDRLWQQDYRNLFGVYSPASGYTLGMLALALIYDLKTIAVVYPDDEFSVSAAEGVNKWAPKFGLDIVSFQKFKKGQRNLVPLAEQARSAKPDLLMVTGHYNEAVDMREALRELKWYPTAYFATIGPALEKYKADLGAAANLTFGSSLWEPEGPRYPGSDHFTESFHRTYDMAPSYHAATAYAAGQILESAILAANSLDRNAVRQALYELQTYSLVGRYAVDPDGLQVKHVPMVIQWQGGEKTIVWPEEIQSAKPFMY
jgi:branched-chain amino acid transport system substrate-binding protein